MFDTLTPLVVVGSFALMFLLFWWGSKKEKERSERIQEFCAQNGYRYDSVSQDYCTQPWKSLRLFQRGHSKTMKNVGSKENNGETFQFFDYRFTTGHGKHRQHHRYFVVGRFGSFKFPSFTLGPENVFSKIAQVVGYADIDFPHDPEFSKAYVLRGENEASIRALISPSIMAALKREQGLYLEANGQGIIFYTLPGRIEDLQTIVSRAQNVLQLFRG